MLSREGFRKAVFKRDKRQCVVPDCSQMAADVCHIIDQSLWSEDEDYGYLVDNGVSLCSEHYPQAEEGQFHPRSCRLWAGIYNRVLPNHLDLANDYDKWGNVLEPCSSLGG